MGMVGLDATMAMDAEAGSVTVRFLRPHLPSSSFSFPELPGGICGYAIS